MNHCVDHQSEWNNYILYFIIIPVACGTHLVVLACMLKMNPSSWSLEFFVQMIMLTTCIYLTMYYHLQLHFIRLQRLIPTIYYVNMIILLRLDIPITSRHTLPLRQPWQSPPWPQYLLLMAQIYHSWSRGQDQTFGCLLATLINLHRLVHKARTCGILS
jgi:hypothetical protein